MRYWIKLYTEILDDPKMGRLSDREYRTCVSLFAMAGREDREGSLPPIDDMAWSLRMTPVDLTANLQVLARLDILEECDGLWVVRKWQERQAKAPSAAPDKVLQRVHEHRERERNETVTTLHPEVKRDVTPPDTDTDTDTDTEKNRKEQRGASAPADAAPTPAKSEKKPLPDYPQAVQIFIANGGKLKAGKLADGTPNKERTIQFITEHIKNDPESLELWGQVVNAYVNVKCWAGTSYTIMVNDYYANGLIPGEKSARSGNNGNKPGYGLTSITGNDRHSRAPTDAERAEFQRQSREMEERDRRAAAGAG
jgi:hypothetical protein